MRLIDADKFLDLLKNSGEGFWRKKHMVNGEPLIESMSYEMNTIRKCVADTDAKAEFTPKWTRVEDGLPEDGEGVIILLKHFYLTRLLLASFDETKARFYRCDRCYGIDEVIAWMPIPKYEAERSEKE